MSGAVAFDPDLAAAGSPPTTRAATGRSSRPQAGHDAGILSAAGIPTAMLFVRNPTGVSHSPAEHAVDRRLPGRRLTRWPTRSSGWPGDASSYLLERAWVDGAVHDDVLVEIEDGRFTRCPDRRNSRLADEVRPVSASFTGQPVKLPRSPGLTIPGLANGHSHAFHRALRGRTQRERGTFWTWREQMYAVAGRLDPDCYFALARATYREMVGGREHERWASSTTCTTSPTGRRTTTRTRWATRCVEAAREAGIRITLLDTCYLSSGFGRAARGRPASATPTATRERAGPSASRATARRRDPLGAGRAARPAAASFQAAAAPLHVHLSEQVAENDACLAAYGVTPTRLLHEAGCSARARPSCTPPT